MFQQGKSGVTDTELMRRIRLGEDSALKMRRVLVEETRVISPRPDDFADELAAFANAKGGVVILGVDDNTRQVLGHSP